MSPDAAYWRDYRARNRERINAQERARRALGRVRGDRSKEYAKRASRAVPRLEALFEHVRRGSVVSFWDDELRMDLEQERALAELEGRDVEEAVTRYRAREYAWHRIVATGVELSPLSSMTSMLVDSQLRGLEDDDDV